MLSRAFWDQNLDDSRLDDFINGKVEEWPEPDRKLFFRRLLSTYDWYTLLKLDKLVKKLGMAKLKIRYTRRSGYF
ncbi:hypothetical protein EPICR_40115 [Candidatus Desulfarcum epimagneticum]|uniref:Uncharacterized protein n=1 Tax=uncultured Desulfobacteraceae bacterium TaxID=218296 RepID=A0A484HJ86_9BACT|nr:hypothetical protein EPICR_40115 [uncultured Desulfobacteraceae bacterium]